MGPQLPGASRVILGTAPKHAFRFLPASGRRFARRGCYEKIARRVISSGKHSGFRARTMVLRAGVVVVAFTLPRSCPGGSGFRERTPTGKSQEHKTGSGAEASAACRSQFVGSDSACAQSACVLTAARRHRTLQAG